MNFGIKLNYDLKLKGFSCVHENLKGSLFSILKCNKGYYYYHSYCCCFWWWWCWFVSYMSMLSINLFMGRNPPVPLKTTSSLVWSWRLWTGRTPTSFVLQQWERSEVRRSSSCLMAGEAPLTTGVPSTPETSSPWDGALWPNTLYSHQETSVSHFFSLISLFLISHSR